MTRIHPTLSVSAGTYQRMVAAAKRRGISISRLLDLAVCPALGIEPPTPVETRKIDVTPWTFVRVRRAAHESDRLMRDVADEAINAALDAAGAE